MILAAILYGLVALLGAGLLVERRARNRQDARDAARLAEIRADADRSLAWQRNVTADWRG